MKISRMMCTDTLIQHVCDITMTVDQAGLNKTNIPWLKKVNKACMALREHSKHLWKMKRKEIELFDLKII